MADGLIPVFIKDGLELVKHSTTLAILLGATGGGIAGWIGKHLSYRKMNFRSRIEFIGVEPVIEGGKKILEFSTHGKQLNLSEVIGLPILENVVKRATKQARLQGGLLRLPNGRMGNHHPHRMMMEMFEEFLTGTDPDANMDAVMGRTDEIDTDYVAFCPTYNRVDGEMSLIRVFIVDAAFLKKFQDPAFCAQWTVRPERHKHRLEILKRIAEELKSPTQKSGDTALVWHTHIKTSRSPGGRRQTLAA